MHYYARLRGIYKDIKFLSEVYIYIIYISQISYIYILNADRKMLNSTVFVSVGWHPRLRLWLPPLGLHLQCAPLLAQWAPVHRGIPRAVLAGWSQMSYVLT